MGGAGVQRWLKMSKYLPEEGWLPVVYTALPKNFVAEDHSLIDDIHSDIEIIRTPIKEPYEIYAFLTGQKKGKSAYSGFITKKKTGLSHKLSLFIRSNIFIPDARKFWIKPSVKYLKKWLKDNQVDAIVSTGPPHSMHMIALGIKKHFPDIPWIADFRDPWSEIDFSSELTSLAFADRKNKRMEHAVLTTANKVVTVTWDWQQSLSKLGNDRHVDLVLNGYDPADFNHFKSESTPTFILCHLGSMNKDRNPEMLWKAIHDLLQENQVFKERLEIHLIGPVDYSIDESLEKYNLNGHVRKIDYLPHDEAIAYLQQCSVLLLPINDAPNSKGILPGKLYEYLATKKPILAVGPADGDIAKILSEFDDCLLAPYENSTMILDYLLTCLKNSSGSAPRNIEKYSRKTHARTYVDLLNSVLPNTI